MSGRTPPDPIDCACGCGTTFQPKTRRVRFIAGHSSRRHMRTSVPFVELDARGCWVWQGARTRDGYPLMWSAERKSMVYAHRQHYEDRHGIGLETKELDHLCRNTLCVNPDHMEPVRHAVNYRRSSRVVLTPTQVEEIRRRHAAGGITQKALGAEYGVGQSHVSQIIRDRIWS